MGVETPYLIMKLSIQKLLLKRGHLLYKEKCWVPACPLLSIIRRFHCNEFFLLQAGNVTMCFFVQGQFIVWEGREGEEGRGGEGSEGEGRVEERGGERRGREMGGEERGREGRGGEGRREKGSGGEGRWEGRRGEGRRKREEDTFTDRPNYPM